MFIMILALLCSCCNGSLFASETIWLEGEAPQTIAVIEGLSVDWSQEQPELCSAGNLLHLACEQLPEDVALRYHFRSNAGSYELWLRLGYEFHRAPFQWRID
jgi:hypothetical protein